MTIKLMTLTQYVYKLVTVNFSLPIKPGILLFDRQLKSFLGYLFLCSSIWTKYKPTCDDDHTGHNGGDWE